MLSSTHKSTNTYSNYHHTVKLNFYVLFRTRYFFPICNRERIRVKRKRTKNIQFICNPEKQEPKCFLFRLVGVKRGRGWHHVIMTSRYTNPKITALKQYRATNCRITKSAISQLKLTCLYKKQMDRKKEKNREPREFCWVCSLVLDMFRGRIGIWNLPALFSNPPPPGA